MPHFRDEIRSLWVHWEKRMYFLCNLPFFLLLITKEQKQAESNFLSPPREKVSLFFHIFVEYIITERNILLVLKFWTRFETVGSECDRKPKTDVHALEFNDGTWKKYFGSVTKHPTVYVLWNLRQCYVFSCTLHMVLWILCEFKITHIWNAFKPNESKALQGFPPSFFNNCLQLLLFIMSLGKLNLMINWVK